MSNLDIALILRLVDRASAPLRQVARNMQGVANAALKLNTNELIESNNRARNALRLQALETGALAFAMGKALGPAIAFESAMADVRRVVEFDEADGLAKLSKDILELSRRLPISAEGIAQIVEAAGQAGLVSDALPDDEQRAQLLAFAESAGKMGVAFKISAEEAGKAMADLRTIFTLTQPEVERLADAVNFLDAGMNSTAADITKVLGNIGGVSRQFGLAEEEAAALGSAFLSVGLAPDRVSTAINALLTRLKNAENETAGFQTGLETLGLTAEGLAAAINEDATGALFGFLEAVEAAENPLGVLAETIGRESSDEIAILVGSLDEARKAFGFVSDEASFAGSMQEEFANRSTTTENNIELLQNRLKELAITLGLAVLPALNETIAAVAPIVSRVAEWAEANPELAATLFKVAAGLLAFKLVSLAVMFPLNGLVGAGLRLLRVMQFLPVAFGLVRAALLGLAVLLGANPIGAAIALIAGAALLIMTNWEAVGRFFADLWGGIAQTFKGMGQLIIGVVTLDAETAVAGLVNIWEGLKLTLGTLGQGIIDIFAGVWDRIVGLADGARAVLDGLFSRSQGATGIPTTGFIGGVAEAPEAARAFGGPVLAGQSFLVGERGPELFSPSTSGTIMPNNRLLIDRRPGISAGLGGVGGGRSISVGQITINPAPGADPHAIARAVRAELMAIDRAEGALHDGGIAGRARLGAF